MATATALGGEDDSSGVRRQWLLMAIDSPPSAARTSAASRRRVRAADRRKGAPPPGHARGGRLGHRGQIRGIWGHHGQSAGSLAAVRAAIRRQSLGAHLAGAEGSGHVGGLGRARLEGQQRHERAEGGRGLLPDRLSGGEGRPNFVGGVSLEHRDRESSTGTWLQITGTSGASSSNHPQATAINGIQQQSTVITCTSEARAATSGAMRSAAYGSTRVSSAASTARRQSAAPS